MNNSTHKKCQNCFKNDNWNLAENLRKDIKTTLEFSCSTCDFSSDNQTEEKTAMTGDQIRLLAIWLLNADFNTFCKGIYCQDGSKVNTTNKAFLRGKFKRAIDNSLLFITELDSSNLNNLAKTLSTYKG